MTEKFYREILGEFKQDDEFEWYVLAWTEYHIAADRIDGHLPMGDSRLAGLATKAGFQAMDRFLQTKFQRPGGEKWKLANREALRRLDRLR